METNKPTPPGQVCALLHLLADAAQHEMENAIKSHRRPSIASQLPASRAAESTPAYGRRNRKKKPDAPQSSTSTPTPAS